jgi:WD40 repeat protein
MSPSGRFVLIAGFTKSVQVREVAFKKDGIAFEGCKQVMTLSGRDGHSGAVNGVGVNNDSSFLDAATCSTKDGTFKLWNLDVQHHNDEDPPMLLSVNVPTQLLPTMDIIALSPDSTAVAVCSGQSVAFFEALPKKGVGGVRPAAAAGKSAADRMLGEIINDTHKGPIAQAAFSPCGTMLATCSLQDNAVRVWKVPSRAD